MTAASPRFDFSRIALVLLTAGIPAGMAIAWRHIPPLGSPPAVMPTGSVFGSSPAIRFAPTAIGPPPTGLPRITNVQIIDLDADGVNEIVACDGQQNAVVAFHRRPEGTWQERMLQADIPAPAHAAPADFDHDGDLDLLIAVLGNLEPDDALVGRVVWLENRDGEFAPRTLLHGVRRVADVQPADFDADGDLDLAVAVFGYSRGEVLWLENAGGDAFREHRLLMAPGAIHVPVADYDGDGDPDIAAIVTQDEEEIWGFENVGDGAFQPRLLKQWNNYDLGGAGLVAADLDRDGDMDLVAPVGDNLEDLDPYPQPYHGCYWLENRGDWNFAAERIARFGGTYAAAVADLNGDRHSDVVLVSMANDFRRPEHASIIWLKNDGRQHFTPWQLASDPIHLVTVACGDINGDGSPDIVAGGLNMRAPFERAARVVAWERLTSP